MDTTAEQFLIRGFRARVPGRQLLERCAAIFGDRGWNSRDAQRRLVAAVGAGVEPDYYLGRFIKLYVSEVDECPEGREDIAEELVDLASTVCALDLPADPETVVEAVYEFDWRGATDCARVGVSRRLSDVHLQVWDAGLFVFECILSDVIPVSGRSVVEIGAGVGMNAVALHRAGAKRAVLTDVDEEAVSWLERTIERNGLDEFAAARVFDVEGADGELFQDELRGDVLIAADVTYDPGLVKSVVRTCHEFLRAGRDREAFIAARVRSELTAKLLEAELEASGMHIMDFTSVARERRKPLFSYARDADREPVDVTLFCLSCES